MKIRYGRIYCRKGRIVADGFTWIFNSKDKFTSSDIVYDWINGFIQLGHVLGMGE